MPRFQSEGAPEGLTASYDGLVLPSHKGAAQFEEAFLLRKGSLYDAFSAMIQKPGVEAALAFLAHVCLEGGHNEQYELATTCERLSQHTVLSILQAEGDHIKKILQSGIQAWSGELRHMTRIGFATYAIVAMSIALEDSNPNLEHGKSSTLKWHPYYKREGRNAQFALLRQLLAFVVHYTHVYNPWSLWIPRQGASPNKILMWKADIHPGKKLRNLVLAFAEEYDWDPQDNQDRSDIASSFAATNDGGNTMGTSNVPMSPRTRNADRHDPEHERQDHEATKADSKPSGTASQPIDLMESEDEAFHRGIKREPEAEFDGLSSPKRRRYALPESFDGLAAIRTALDDGDGFMDKSFGPIGRSLTRLHKSLRWWETATNKVLELGARLKTSKMGEFGASMSSLRTALHAEGENKADADKSALHVVLSGTGYMTPMWGDFGRGLSRMHEALSGCMDAAEELCELVSQVEMAVFGEFGESIVRLREVCGVKSE